VFISVVARTVSSPIVSTIGVEAGHGNGRTGQPPSFVVSTLPVTAGFTAEHAVNAEKLIGLLSGPVR
jgi:hypothetical protein